MLALANSQAEGLPPLYEVDQEVKAIARLFKTRLLIGENATESGLKEYVGHYSILHLAAHGELNTTSPLFSRIVLSPDQKNDGALEVHEVYELDLQQTHLVVLSACETHLGKQSRGDDIIGLTRAFMYAGTPSVIASLWKVDDRATSDFMTDFYKHLKQGKSKAEALQIAQKKTRNRYPHPYYWAAFVLTGDPGITIDRFPWLKVLIIGLIIGGILVVILVKLKTQGYGVSNRF
jgi:CHAT domain-containing protein